MDEELVNKAEKFIGIQEKVEMKQKKVQELQAEVFGEGSEETEKKAREFFSNVGGSREQSSKTQEIDDLKEDLTELEETLETTREDLQKLLVEVQFPLDETIDARDNSVVFPYSEELPEEVIDAIEITLDVDLSKNPVIIDTAAIRVETTNVDGAMDQAMNRIEEVRSKANMMVDVEQFVEEIRGRDEKIAKAMYVLYKSNESLTKKELEEQIGVETGELRGNLYYVLDNDPYLQKAESKFSLTDIGTRVMEAYEERYGRPDGLPKEVEA